MDNFHGHLYIKLWPPQEAQRFPRRQNNPPQICVAFVKLIYRKNLSSSLQCCCCIFWLGTITGFTGKAGFTCLDTGKQDLEIIEVHVKIKLIAY